jgi:hypothetical protein
MAKQKDDKIDALFTKGLRSAKAAPPVENGRKRGKSTDPEWGKFTILLKRDTQKQASRLAEDMNPRRDLSDVAQELLNQWIENQARRM